MTSRRRFLQTVAAGTATLGMPGLRAQGAASGNEPLFTLGVASGMPGPSGVVLWTRLAPDPQHERENTGLRDAAVPVQWELAHDERFTRPAAGGHVEARADDAHSVHVEVTGLAPGRDYFYRFTARGQRSPTGRTRTAPAPDAPASPLRLALASCQQYEQGYYGAYRDMAAQPLDLVLHLGDYIYESSWGVNHVRRHTGGLPTMLGEFRDRYALYKADADLQAAHAAFPWLVTWDDHEVANDYTDDVSPHTPDPEQFLRIRAAAYQAWWEHMPVPMSMRPRGPNVRIYGQHRFGGMLDLLMLDGRQYRSHHACRGKGVVADCADRTDPARTYFGLEQEAWIDAQLARPGARWTVLAQGTLVAPAERGRGPLPAYWMDGWDGYPAARERLLGSIATRRPRNTLVLSGDVHAFYAADLRAEGREEPVATEFVSGSITSQGPGPEIVTRILQRNPGLRYGRSDRRGYALMTLASKSAEVELRAVLDVTDPRTLTETLARFSVAEGQAGVQLHG